jgi:hypothetical protein
MPIAFHMHPTLPLLLTRITGHFAMAEIREYTLAIGREPRFGPDLCDLVEMVHTTSDITPAEWSQYKAWREPFPALQRTAIVAPTPLEFGLARMYQLAAERPDGKVGVFRTRAEAIRWLGHEPEEIAES